MPKVAVYNSANQQVGDIELNDSIFGVEMNAGLVHQAVVMQLASRRLGTHATKTRGLVRGGGRKPWRQKGTGRARSGSTRSPLCASGGFHACNVRAQLRHTRADAAAIQLDLRLTGTPGTDTRAACDAATGLTGHGLAPAAQTRQQVLKLGQLHLRLTLTRLGVLSKNIEDEGGAINDLSVDDIFQPAALGGSQLLVDDDGVGLDAAHDVS